MVLVHSLCTHIAPPWGWGLPLRAMQEVSPCRVLAAHCNHRGVLAAWPGFALVPSSRCSSVGSQGSILTQEEAVPAKLSHLILGLPGDITLRNTSRARLLLGSKPPAP